MYEILGKESDKRWKILECDYDVSKTGKRQDFNVSSSVSPATQECQLLNRLKPMWQVTGYYAGQLGGRDSLFKEWYPWNDS